MSPELTRWIRDATGASAAERGERIQSLWSGYGEIFRVHLRDAATPSVVVKHVQPRAGRHPRGWDGDRSHQRKLRSYDVEMRWYRDWSVRCGSRVPDALALSADDDGWRFLLEDLDAVGFAGRTYDPDEAAIGRCLDWLATFHATFLGAEPTGLWDTGTYWHLATRPDELAVTPPGPLRDAADALDAALSEARFLTLVHGDAKVGNFCFGDDAVAAVDFQYVGGGCGMKDLAYFIGSVHGERDCARHAPRHLDRYFSTLHSLVDPADADDLEAEWRALYPLAWADFHRFLAGWSPGHRKIHGYSDEMVRQALHALR